MLAHSQSQFSGSLVTLVGISKLHNSLASSWVSPEFLLASFIPWHLCTDHYCSLLQGCVVSQGSSAWLPPAPFFSVHLQHAWDTASTKHKGYSLLGPAFYPRQSAPASSLQYPVSIRQDQTPASLFVHPPRFRGAYWSSSRTHSVFSTWGCQCELGFLPLHVSGASLVGFPISMSNSLPMGKKIPLKLLETLMITYQKVYFAF